MNRPVNKLYYFEVNSNDHTVPTKPDLDEECSADNVSDQNNLDKSKIQTVPKSSKNSNNGPRARRNAAIIGEMKRRINEI